jgi:hypothetical protein
MVETYGNPYRRYAHGLHANQSKADDDDHFP